MFVNHFGAKFFGENNFIYWKNILTPELALRKYPARYSVHGAV